VRRATERWYLGEQNWEVY